MLHSGNALPGMPRIAPILSMLSCTATVRGIIANMSMVVAQGGPVLYLDPRSPLQSQCVAARVYIPLQPAATYRSSQPNQGLGGRVAVWQ